MNIIIKKVILRDAPAPTFVGTRITIDTRLKSAEATTWAIRSLSLAESSQTGKIDWGDGHSEEVSASGSVQHVYTTPGAYVVELSDDFESLSLIGRGTEYSTEYGPMTKSFYSNAQVLVKIVSRALYLLSNLTTFDMTNTQLTSMPGEVLMSCPKLTTLDGLPRNITVLNVRAFKNDSGIIGRVNLPHVNEIRGISVENAPFYGCTGITEIHFAAANEEAIKSSSLYQICPNLGAENATLYFDL